MAFRLSSSSAALVAAALFLGGCAGSRPAVRPAGADERTEVMPIQRPGLLFQVEPREAQITIDGKPFGRVSDLAGTGGLLALDPGLYQVSLKAPGYVTWRAEVAVRGDQAEPIRITLSKR